MAAIFDRKWAAVYTIAIYGRLYTADYRQRLNIDKKQMAAIFFSRFKSLADEFFCLAAYMPLIIVVVSFNLH